MAYKCIPFSGGVDVSVNESNYFTFRSQTHNLINTGNGNVRIQRKIDLLFEVLDTPITDFVDTNEIVIATTYTQLSMYFLADRNVMAGEGVSVVNGTVSVVAGGPSTLGGFKVGTGLTVDGSGRLSASATSEITRILSSEAEMLALPVEELRSYRVIRLDTKRLYYTNAGATPSVLGNWFVGPSIEAAVLSFKGRTGAVDSEFGDYNFDMIPMVDKTSSATHTLEVDSGKLYIKNISTSTRVEISYTSDLESVSSKVTNLEDLVSDPSNGVIVRVDRLEPLVAQQVDIVSNSTTGLQVRVKRLEDKPDPVGTDFGPQIEALQAKDIEQDDALTVVDQKVDSVANNNVVLDTRLTAIENRPAGTDYSTQIQALKDKDVAQDTKLLQIDSTLLTTVKLGSDGKVSRDYLPDSATAKKVTVANRAARLQLASHDDLTIAYESDTADAWALNANTDPSIDSNWSPLGNSKAAGVLSFNNRTGAIIPQQGDYNASQILELVDKRFVTTEQIAGWDNKETTTGSQTKATVVKTYADATFVPKTQLGAPSGVATLGADGKVLPSQIPPVGAVTPRVWRDAKVNRIVSAWISNRTGFDMIVYISTLPSTLTTRQISVLLRQPDISGAFTFKSPSVGVAGDKTTQLTVTVPNGCDYQLSATGGTTLATTENWLELS